MHAGICQRQQFGACGHRVAVAVPPHAQLRIGGVGGVDPAVVVAVQVGQRGEAVGRPGAAGQNGVVAEQFAAIVDLAVAVPVPHQQAVVLAGPASGFREAVAVVVEVNSN